MPDDDLIFVPIDPEGMTLAVFMETLVRIIPSVEVRGMMARMPTKATTKKELQEFYFRQFEEYDLQVLDESTAEGILRERLSGEEWKVFTWLVYITN